MEQKQTRTEKNSFNLYHYPQLISHLEQQASEGWLLTDCTDTDFEFTRCQPQKVHFAVTFYPDYDYLAIKTPEKLEQLWEFCRLNDWEHITGNATMQIFCNKRDNPVPLHTDAVVQMDNFHDMMRAGDLKLWKQNTIINGFVVVFIAALFFFVRSDGVDLQQFLMTASPVMVLIFIHDIWQFVTNGAQWLRYSVWYRAARMLAQNENIFMPPKENKLLKKLDVAVAVAFIVVLIANMFIENTFVVFITGLAVVLTTIFCYIFVARLLKREGVPADENRLITALIVILVTVVSLHVAGAVLIWLGSHGIIEPVIKVTTIYP